MSNGIQKFLEEKKLEDERKARETRIKLAEKVARRSGKEQRKIDKSLKVIKSSKKFHSGDAALDENTLQSEQPDEDDYGYTSATSDIMHKKLMEKYHTLPEEKKFSSGLGSHKAMTKEEMQRTKERVKNSFNTIEDVNKQVSQQRSTQSKHKHDRDIRNGAGSSSSALPGPSLDKKVVNKPRPKLKAAPIVDFQQLLKLAEQKQHEDITIEMPVKKEPERLLTLKEKRELEEVEAARRAKMKLKLNAIPRLGAASKNDKNNNESSSKAPPANGNAPSKTSISRQAPEKFKKPLQPTTSRAGTSQSKLRDALQKPSSSTSSSKAAPPSKISQTSAKSKEVFPKNNDSSTKGQSSTSQYGGSKPSSSSEAVRSRDFPPKDLLRTREFPPKDLIKSRPLPSKGPSRPFPPKDLKVSKQQKESRKRKLRIDEVVVFHQRQTTVSLTLFKSLTFVGRIIEDEESDYDSEMDDFIDDDEGEADYSSEIQKMFGYDKSRYRDEEFDDREMESDFRTVMREEFISKKLGLLEDLEDMKMEAEEKKRKEMRKKRKL